MIYLIGIDCAAQDVKCGLALGTLSDDRVTVLEVATKEKSVLPTLSRWFREHDPAVVAMDAPLGWPDPLGSSLSLHQAGEPIGRSANELFRRTTDLVVREITKKQPLDVGADKIARVALRAVKLIGELREATGQALPLALTAGVPDYTAVVEVYPALTLRSRGLSDVRYKGSKPEHRDQRARLLDDLGAHVDLPRDTSSLADSDDAFDATVCLLAAADFCAGRVLEPRDVRLAQKEGWIWFRPPDKRD
jgi:predicted nuclease with RNAse H fold